MIKKTIAWGIQKAKNLWADSLYRNSFWLMAGSFSMAGIGFFYWIIAARLYSPEQIGLATTFLSAASLISSLAMLGFGTTLIRYLPTSEVKEKKISTAFTVVVIASLDIGAIYLFGLSYWTPKLLFIRSSIPLMLLMFLFFPINTINGITDSVFTALREAHWVFVSNVTQSLTKLVILVLFASLGVWGVIGSNMVAVLVATLLCLLLINRRFKIRLYPLIDKSVLLLVRKFAFGNYLSNIINILPSLILPIIITNLLTPKDTAYFHMPNMIVALLTLVPSTIARSYFAEISHANKSISFKRPLILTYGILVPVVILLVILGKFILHYFGADYAAEGYTYLVLISISILISVISYFLGSILLLRQDYRGMVISSSIGAGINILASLALLKYGITGVGIAGIITQLCVLIVLLVFTYKRKI